MTIFPFLVKAVAAVSAASGISSAGVAPTAPKPSLEPAGPEARSPKRVLNVRGPSFQDKPNPNYFNPQISVVGDFAARLKDDGLAPGEKNHADFREVEFAFASEADPFLRVELYLSVAKENGESKATVEEAFGLYKNLGHNLQAKFGRIAAAIGRVQRNHIDQLNYLDYPLVIQDTLGGEGLREPGASLSYLFPGKRFSELTVEALDAGDEHAVFNGSSTDKLVYVGHARTFFDFTEDLSAQLGATVATGPSTASAKRGDLFGLDYVMKWQPGRKGKSAMLEAEGYWSKPGGSTDRKFGWFGRFTYEVMPRGFLTLGYDQSELLALPPGNVATQGDSPSDPHHHGWLAGFTFKVTEFHQLRLEFQRVSSNFDATRNLLTFQLQWAIGAHPAHKY